WPPDVAQRLPAARPATRRPGLAIDCQVWRLLNRAHGTQAARTSPPGWCRLHGRGHPHGSGRTLATDAGYRCTERDDRGPGLRGHSHRVGMRRSHEAPDRRARRGLSGRSGRRKPHPRPGFLRARVRAIALLYHLGWLILATAALPLRAAVYPAPVEGDYLIKAFRFSSGETLPELRIHYRTVGKLAKGPHGSNAVLVLHGTTGSGGNFIRPEFAGELFGPGQPLDATRFFIVLPDGIGHGKSSKPS